MADPIIVECKSEYHGDQDVIQVIGILATPEGVSLHRSLLEAKFSLLFNGVAQGVIPVTQESYVIPTERHESGEGWNVLEDELGDFKGFFYHYPRSRELEVEWYVKLKDGREARARRPVLIQNETKYPYNPILAGHPEPEWKKQVIRDYERPR